MGVTGFTNICPLLIPPSRVRLFQVDLGAQRERFPLNRHLLLCQAAPTILPGSYSLLVFALF